MARKALPRSAAIGIVATTKFAKIITVLKFAKFTKLLVTATSMLISALAYGFAFGPLFAVALIGMLFVHEMGHVIALRHKGYPVTLPVFIPFLGAAIFVPNMGDRDTEAYVGYGGPLLGSLAAFASVVAWWLTQSPFLLFTAFLGVYLNLFNMIPIRPFDGGRILQIGGPYFKYLGLAALIVYTLYLRQPSLILLWLLVMMEIWFPLWWRPAIGVLLTVAMTVLFVEGYSPIENEPIPVWAVAVDVVAACLFTAMFVHTDYDRWRHQQRMRYYEQEMDRIEAEARKYNVTLPPRTSFPSPYENADNRAYPTLSTRMVWTVIYFTSVVVLWGTMAYLVEQMQATLPH